MVKITPCSRIFFTTQYPSLSKIPRERNHEGVMYGYLFVLGSFFITFTDSIPPLD